MLGINVKKFNNLFEICLRLSKIYAIIIMWLKTKGQRMNTFYFFENNVYETKEEALNATKNYNNKKIDEIETSKNFATFENDYQIARDEGNSCLDSIEWAK